MSIDPTATMMLFRSHSSASGKAYFFPNKKHEMSDIRVKAKATGFSLFLLGR